MPIKTSTHDWAVAQLYLRSDHNKDKTITLDELTARLAKDGISQARATEAFKAADRDNNGKVTVEEVRQRALEVQRTELASAHGAGLESARGARLKNSGLSPADLDKDGVVTKGELAALPTSLASRQTAFFLDLLDGGGDGFFTQQTTGTRAYDRPVQPAQPGKKIRI